MKDEVSEDLKFLESCDDEIECMKITIKYLQKMIYLKYEEKNLREEIKYRKLELERLNKQKEE